MTRRSLPLLAALAVLALGLAGCGGGGGNEAATTSGGASSGGGGETLQIAADPSGALKFTQSSLQTSAGKVTIDFTNQSSLPHDVKLEGPGVNGEGTDTVTGSSTSATLDLKPGTYTFYCVYHRSQGMVGTITVT